MKDSLTKMASRDSHSNWIKFSQAGHPDSSFAAWSKRIALYQVKAMRRDAGRNRLLFDDALLDQLAEKAELVEPAVTARSVALERCLAKLSDEHRDLIERRYADTSPLLAEIAAEVGKSVTAVTVALSRIRHGLIECVKRELAREGQP